jgi:hypothetical protein
MSFEGYYEVICKNGHFWANDLYSDKKVCPFCGECVAWWNLIDETNGEGKPTELQVESESVFCKCSLCGDKHVKEQARYKIPENVGHKE